MKYIVRQGKKKGRGYYLTLCPFGAFNNGFYHYTKQQRKAYRFDTIAAAMKTAKGCTHIAVYRVIQLVKKP